MPTFAETTSSVASTSAASEHSIPPSLVAPLAVLGTITGASALALLGVALYKHFLSSSESEDEGLPISNVAGQKASPVEPNNNELDLKNAVALHTLEKFDPLSSKIYGDVVDIAGIAALVDHFPLDRHDQFMLLGPSDRFSLGPYDRVALNSYFPVIDETYELGLNNYVPSRRAPIFNREAGTVEYPEEDVGERTTNSRDIELGDSTNNTSRPPLVRLPTRARPGYF